MRVVRYELKSSPICREVAWRMLTKQAYREVEGQRGKPTKGKEEDIL